MKTVFNFFMVLHIAGGAIGLLSGSINLLRRKGDRVHRVAGKVFFISMLTAGFSSLVLAAIHPNYFLLMVGIFTLYLVGTGRRYVYLKMLGRNQKPALLDWGISVTMLLSGLLFIVLGIYFVSQAKYFGIVFLAFGVIGLFFVRADYNNYRKKFNAKNYWLLAHLQRMTGGYIAALTAFLVVNEKYSPFQLPAAVFWLMPTVILVPFIIRWSRKYEVRN